MNKNSLIENRALNVILTDCSPNWGGQQYRLLKGRKGRRKGRAYILNVS